MLLAPYFELTELLQSSHSTLEEQLAYLDFEKLLNLGHLCTLVLSPIRLHIGQPVRVISGLRNPILNKRVSGVSNSQHLLGYAADIVFDGMEQIEDILKSERIHFDQCVLEKCNSKGVPSWIHISYNPNGNRMQILRT